MEKATKAIKAIHGLFDKGITVFVAWSGGKDSQTCLSLVFKALLTHPNPTKVVVTHGNTGVENPEIVHYVRDEIQKIKNFAEIHNLDVEVHVCGPTLNSTWQVRVIGGRALPAFPNNNSDCSVDWKVRPQQKLKKQLIRTHSKACTIVGTRFAESTTRMYKMSSRKENAEKPWLSSEGDYCLSPIAHWSSEDVWNYLSKVQKDGEGHSDLKDLFRLYKDGGFDGNDARYGCWCCAKSQDRTMQNLLQADPERYGYMQGLHNLQQFLRLTQYDVTRRDWMGRSVDDQGCIRVYPDVYSPAMLEEILLYCLTLDIEEMNASFDLGIDPRFQIITPEILIAIDAMWSYQGRHMPFHALYCYDLVYNQGRRYYPPTPETIEATMNKDWPTERFYHIGDPMGQNLHSGLRDITLELVAGEDSFCRRFVQDKNGDEVQFKKENGKWIKAKKSECGESMTQDYNSDICFDVDIESAYLILDFELEYLLRTQHNRKQYCTSGYHYYLRMGTISIAKSSVASIDAVLRRTNWKDMHGFGPYSINYKELWEASEERRKESVSQAFLPGMEPPAYDFPEIPVSRFFDHPAKQRMTVFAPLRENPNYADVWDEYDRLEEAA